MANQEPNRYREVRDFINDAGKWDSLLYLVSLFISAALYFYEDGVKQLIGSHFPLVILSLVHVVPLLLVFKIYVGIKKRYLGLIEGLESRSRMRLAARSRVEPLFGSVNQANGVTQRQPLRDTAFLEIENIGDEAIPELTAAVYLVDGEQRIRLPSYWISLVHNGQQKDVVAGRLDKCISIPRDDLRYLAVANFGTGAGWTRLGSPTLDALCLMTPAPTPVDEGASHTFRHFDTGMEELQFPIPAKLEVVFTSAAQKQKGELYLDLEGRAPRIDPEKIELIDVAG